MDPWLMVLVEQSPGYREMTILPKDAAVLWGQGHPEQGHIRISDMPLLG